MRIDDIHISFDPRGIAGLHGLTLHLTPGEIFAVMGSSGAGKTTLLRILSCEITPAKGQVVPAERVALMDNRFHPNFEGTIQQWLMSGVKRAMDTEKKFQLARDLADAFEIPMQLGRRLAEISEGQKQRARLAFALIDNPELLLLDEPFAHLDAPLRAELMNLLKKYVKSRAITVVWVTHDRHEALSLSDRLGVMHFGKWEQVGTPQEVFWNPRTLVTAKLLGHENLVTAHRTDPNHQFQTPLGNWNSQGVANGKTHTVVSIPPHALKLDPQGIWPGYVLETLFLGHHSLVRLECQGHEWLVEFHGPYLRQVQVGEIRRFNVDLSQGVGIDCL